MQGNVFCISIGRQLSRDQQPIRTNQSARCDYHKVGNADGVTVGGIVCYLFLDESSHLLLLLLLLTKL